jgi:Xylose isomerase-like TIM barrel
VYSPDWSTPDRLRYTVDLARVLARLLPDDVTGGSVSTLPLAWCTAWAPVRRAAVRRNLDLLAEELAGVAEQEGRAVTVGFEPEPGCVVESTQDAARELSDVDYKWLGLCLDTCHLAVAFEEPSEALDRLAAAGLGVVKVQASCALHAEEPSHPDTRAALASFAEPRFLHQTRERAPGGPLAVDDLDEALAPDGPLPGRAPWRVHFHAPLHAEPAAPLATTRDVLQRTLAALLAGPAARTRHVEVETYTWQVLPAAQRPDGPSGLVDGIAAEVGWVRGTFSALGLREVVT